MPCNSDHLEATQHEKEMSRVMILLDEVNGRFTGNPSKRPGWDGYDKRVYNSHMTKQERDAKVAELCGACRRIGPAGLTARSLELQLWFRNHEEADAARVKQERREQIEREATAKAKKKAAKVLTKRERKALGL